MGLFDKKYCDICGEKIGLLGNRKLEDGNLCKDCAKKLSPWFSERRSSTVAEIKAQIDWREANRERAAQFCTTRTFGERTKLLLDEQHRWFAVTHESNPATNNADVLDFSAITACRTDIDENRIELKMETKDSEGKIVRRSYNPLRYEYNYDFYITISVNVPYFSEMKFKLNDSRVHIPFQPTTVRWSGSSFLQGRHEEPLYDPCYRGYKEACDEICSLLKRICTGEVNGQQAGATTQGVFSVAALIPGLPSSPAAEKAIAEFIKYSTWICSSCHLPNNGTDICQHCGAPISDEKFLADLKKYAFAAAMLEGVAPGNAAMPTDASVQNSAVAQSWNCPFCGAANQGKFCESCGAKRP